MTMMSAAMTVMTMTVATVTKMTVVTVSATPMAVLTMMTMMSAAMTVMTMTVATVTKMTVVTVSATPMAVVTMMTMMSAAMAVMTMAVLTMPKFGEMMMAVSVAMVSAAVGRMMSVMSPTMTLSVTATMSVAAGVLPVMREVSMAVAILLAAQGGLTPRSPPVFSVPGVTRTVLFVALGVGSTAPRTSPRWTSVAVWPPRRSPALTRGSLGVVVVSIASIGPAVSIGVRSVARIARVSIIAGFVRVVVMSAPAFVSADLTIPTAETGSAARAIPLGGARADLIVV
jgi:hypothetical protein